MNHHDTRRKNLQMLIDKRFGGVSRRLALQCNVDPASLSRILGPGARVNLGDRLARKIEAAVGLREGWLDESSAKRAPVVAAFGHQPAPVVSFAVAASWIGDALKPYPLDEFVEMDWVKSKRENARLIGINVEAEDMAPQILAGDVVFLDPTLIPQPGDVVFARVENDVLVLRKYRHRGRDSKDLPIQELVPLNLDFPTFILDSTHPGSILGTMIEHRRYTRRHPSLTETPPIPAKGTS